MGEKSKKKYHPNIGSLVAGRERMPPTSRRTQLPNYAKNFSPQLRILLLDTLTKTLLISLIPAFLFTHLEQKSFGPPQLSNTIWSCFVGKLAHRASPNCKVLHFLTPWLKLGSFSTIHPRITRKAHFSYTLSGILIRDRCEGPVVSGCWSVKTWTYLREKRH